MLTPQGFRLGPLFTDLLIVEGDGEHPIPEHSARIILDPQFVNLPDELAEWREEIEAEQARRRNEGLTHFWNGLRYAVAGFSVTRVGVDEEPEIFLRLKNADYFTFLAAQQLDREFRDGSTPRSRYLDPEDPQNAPDFMCCSFGVNVAVVSADNKAIFARRSAQVGSGALLWNSSVNEAISRSLDSQGRKPPNLFDVARRGISEELAIHSNEYGLELLAISIDVNKQQWGALFLASLNRLSAHEVVERRSRGVPDKWENTALDYEEFQIDPVIKYLLRPDRINDWATSAAPLFYLSLVRRFGRASVEQRSTQIIAGIDSA
ncbi:hypothetical protein FrEUN1fDRAFT_0908 [Parafrankia sp. EUN1f]|nr:hypothetical protein FrEUN1fDRAFT_0908 [Parafrankia sp. EUN1f]